MYPAYPDRLGNYKGLEYFTKFMLFIQILAFITGELAAITGGFEHTVEK